HLFGSHWHHRGHGHTHTHDHSHQEHHDQVDETIEEEEREIEQDWSRQRSDWTAILGLLALLTFSPCEAFLPVFLTGAKYGWIGFALLSAVLAIATVAGVVVFTWLAPSRRAPLRLK